MSPVGGFSVFRLPVRLRYCFASSPTGQAPRLGRGDDPGRLPERPKGADCKSAGNAYSGSNPLPATVAKVAPDLRKRGQARFAYLASCDPRAIRAAEPRGESTGSEKPANPCGRVGYRHRGGARPRLSQHPEEVVTGPCG